MALLSVFLKLSLIVVICGYVSSKSSFKQLSNNSTYILKDIEPRFQLLKDVSDNNNQSNQCPVWSNSNTDCRCDVNLNNVVLCNADSLNVQACYCVYYDNESNKLVVGYCLFTCYLPKQKLYYTLKRTNRTQINEQMCSGELLGHGTQLHRTGRLCGKCKQGYGLPVYSYHFFQCVKCPQPSYKNWLWYFAMALGPLTIFYFIVMIFEINATSGRLNMYVFCCQVISMPAQMRIFTTAIEVLVKDSASKKITYLLLSFYGIWNLDFFRMLYSPSCIHPEMTTLQILSMDYIIAIYPVFLTIITYVLVWMNLTKFRIVSFLWRPFYWCLRRFRRHWNIQTSLIKVFATFLLLSYVKLLGVSCDLLVPTHIFRMNGNSSTSFTVQISKLYYDATVEMFGPDHLPYAVLAIVVLTLFILLPLALFCLYPSQCFQKLLNWCGLRCQALHTFMDVYTGLYRHEPYDWRYFAALHVLGRIVSLLAFDFLLSLYVVPVIATMAVVGALLIAMIQPNKSSTHNTIDIVLLLVMAASYLGFTAIIFASFVTPGSSQRLVTRVVATSLIYLPALYPVVFCFRFIYRKAKKIHSSKHTILPSCLGRHNSVDSLPDRMVNGEEYPPLLVQETAQNRYNGSSMGQLPLLSAANDTY